MATRDQKEVASCPSNRGAPSGVDRLYRNASFPECDAAGCREVEGRVWLKRGKVCNSWERRRLRVTILRLLPRVRVVNCNAYQ